MYRVLVIEDSKEDAELLVRHIERYGRERCEQIRVTVMRSAMEYISTGGTYSLVFMDIDLPGINGMEAAHLLRTYDPVTPLVFVTNLAQYAVRGYEVNATDFIVKPVGYYDFAMRMDKAMRVVRRQLNRAAMVKTADGVRLVPVCDLVYVEVYGHNLTYGIADEEEPLKARGSLAQVERELEGSSMVRISNSCLVNVDHIRSITGNVVHLTTGEEFSFSRTRKTAAMKAIADYLGGAR